MTTVSSPDPSAETFKQAVKDAVLEVFGEQRELFHELFVEALEDFALANAIRDGRDSKEVSRDDVFQLLEPSS